MLPGFLTLKFSSPLKQNCMKRFVTMLLLFATISTFAQQQTNTNCCNPYPKTINVTGSAEMELVPDEIYVNIHLREYEKRGEPKMTLDKIKENFFKICKEAGIADSSVSIASYGGYDKWYWKQARKGKTPELNASIIYQVKFSNSKMMDELVDKLDDEATQSFNISHVSHSKIREYRTNLKIMAIKAAKEKANNFTNAIGETLGSAVTITEPTETDEGGLIYKQSQTNVAANQGYYNKTSVGDVLNPELMFKKMKLRYEVNVLFALK
jgi:uncharacterized protein